MSMNEKVLLYLAENSLFYNENNCEHELFEKLAIFEDFIASKEAELPTANKVIVRFTDKFNNAQTDDEHQNILFDYSVFMNLLKNYITNGIKPKDDSEEVDKSYYCRSNFDDCFLQQNFLNKYSSDEEQNHLACEPIFLFDDEGFIKSINEIQNFPILIYKKDIVDTQVMNEAQGTDPTKNYNLDSAITSIGRILQTAKNIGSPDLFKTIVKLRGELIKLNDKPIPFKYRLLGNVYPPEAFVVWRLDEKLQNLKKRGNQLLAVVKQAEDDENGITPEEVEDIKQALTNVLAVPSQRFTAKTMGSLMLRTVQKLENSIYFTNPQQLADDFGQALEANAEKLGDRDNKYYVALQAMFNRIPTVPSGFSAPKDQFTRDTSYAYKGKEETQEEAPQATVAVPQSKRRINYKDPQQIAAFRDTIAKISNTLLAKDPNFLQGNSERFKQALVNLASQM